MSVTIFTTEVKILHQRSETFPLKVRKELYSIYFSSRKLPLDYSIFAVERRSNRKNPYAHTELKNLEYM